MKVKLWNAIGRMWTISFGVLFGLGFYSGNRLLGYCALAIFYICCIIDTMEENKDD